VQCVVAKGPEGGSVRKMDPAEKPVDREDQYRFLSSTELVLVHALFMLRLSFSHKVWGWEEFLIVKLKSVDDD
jgi:hypothetical protein